MKKVVLKLGGSAITKNSKDFPLSPLEIYERSEEFIKEEVIEKAARDIKKIKENEDISLVILNGAGPFGHFLVDKHLEKGEPAPEVIHFSVEFLNLIISKIFNEEGLKTVPISPYNCCVYTRKGFLIRDLFSKARNLLNKGSIPISYGDLVRTRGRKGRLGDYEVISGDDIALGLAFLWEPDRILMGTDVEGVYNKNPKQHEDAELIREMIIKKKEELKEISGDMNKVDVTGGIRGKVGKLFESGVESYIFKLSGSNLKKALNGEHVGTKIMGMPR